MTGRSPDAQVELTRTVEVVLRRRWVVLSLWSTVLSATALAAFSTRPVYQASALLIIEKEKGGGVFYTNGTSIENSHDDYYQTQYKLLQSLTLIREVHDKLSLRYEEEFAEPRGAEKLRAALAISPVLRSRLVHVRVTSRKPELAARIANAVSATFVSQNLANQLFISKEILQALQEPKGRERRSYDSLPAVVNNPLIQTLNAEQAKLSVQAAELAQKYTLKHPSRIALNSRMEALRFQIRAETDKVIQSLKLELSGQLKGNNVRVIDPAEPPESPIKPNKRVMLLLGLFGGLFVGLAAAFLVELLDQTVRTHDDVEQRLGLPFLGVVPRASRTVRPVYAPLLSKQPGRDGEAIRNLRTMIDFAGVSQKANAFMVSSSVQDEGKTYVASNLAVVFALLGERVLIIDGDMRRPGLEERFGLSRRAGLSEFLASSRSVDDVEPLIQQTEIPGLSALAGGIRPPNPSELLNTPRLGALTAWAQARFDRVIVDCPPIFPVADTLIWGRHVGSCVWVVRYGGAPLPLVRTASQRLQAAGVKILGVAINAVTPGGLNYAAYGYHQQYYHDYSRSNAPVA